VYVPSRQKIHPVVSMVKFENINVRGWQNDTCILIKRNKREWTNNIDSDKFWFYYSKEIYKIKFWMNKTHLEVLLFNRFSIGLQYYWKTWTTLSNVMKVNLDYWKLQTYTNICSCNIIFSISVIRNEEKMSTIIHLLLTKIMYTWLWKFTSLRRIQHI